MNCSFSYTEEELTQLYNRHVDMLYKLCYVYLKNSADTEDAVQSVFIKLLQSYINFNDHEHEKAWLIVSAKNHCKDIVKSWWRQKRIDLNTLPELPCYLEEKETGDVLIKLLALPEKYRVVLYLYYFEEYSTKEVAQLLGIKESTIRTRLERGRKRLKIHLGGDYFEQKNC